LCCRNFNQFLTGTKATLRDRLPLVDRGGWKQKIPHHRKSA